jgi:tRNA nucleotidyltransferase (CCA-adding enzyme)
MSTPKHWRTKFLQQEPILVTAITKLAEAVQALEPVDDYAPVVPQLVIVGGYVRDLLLDKRPKDADVEVYGVAPERLQAVVNSLFGEVDVIGQTFGILKVMLADGYELDVAIPRTESKVGAGHKGFMIESNPALSFREAARRRDFTVNAIALDPLTGKLFDPYSGLDDLDKAILRVVDEQTFQEDPLRVFRGVQLAARLNCSIEPKTRHLLKQMVQRGDLEQLTPERITAEWQKLLLRARRPSLGLVLMLELGIVSKYYPELAALVTTPQEPEWHPEGNVWIHTGMVLDQAALLIRQPERRLTRDQALTVMLSALCHDFGKALVTHIDNGKIRSHGHEEAGEAPARSFLAQFNFSRDCQDQVVKITKDHLKVTRLYLSYKKAELDDRQYANSVRRLLRRLSGVPFEVYLTVTEADKRGRGLPDATTAPYNEGESFRSLLVEHDLEQQAKTPLVSGAKILAEFKLDPGPRIGELIAAVEAARDAGEVQTEAEGLEMIKRLL